MQPRLKRNFADQDGRFARAFAILKEEIAQHAFPGAAVSIVFRRELVALKAVGRFTYDVASPAVTANTIFDLASLTKVLATTPMAMLLYQRGFLDLDAPVVSVAPLFDTGDARRHKITIRMLLAHSSGLPAYVRLFENCRTWSQLVDAAYRTPLATEPGTRAEYSDIGFIILGEILQDIAEDKLDRFCQREVFGPLGLIQTGFCPPRALGSTIPPTQDDATFRHRIIQGEVNDDNAAVMGGVAGHAGLFANAADVAQFALCMLDNGAPIFRSETVELFTRRASAPPGTSRTLGWDTPSEPSQSGRYFSPRSYGHLGFTGTSLWIDPERELAVTLLTNRTWPDRKSQAIKQIRPRFHDAVAEALR